LKAKADMNFKDVDIEKLLDDVGTNILYELQENARISFSELGRRVGLTSPAVAERVRRMEEAGIITGYHAHINPEKLGRTITAYIRVDALDGNAAPLRRLVVDIPQITECHYLTGTDDLLIKASFTSVNEMEAVLMVLSKHGEVTTSLVLSSSVSRRSVR
jgi:Lrp/AsnC family transcriptional regulator, leucine-responsive regulatory protein